jgi:transcriptional regulator with XRE-family HTH domain
LQPTGEWLNQPGGLAERLARLRRAAGLRGEQMAEHLGWPRTKISKLENGRQMPTAADLTAWAAECGQPDAAAELLDMLAEAQSIHRQYRRLARGHASLQRDFDRFVREAKRIRDFEISFIPGLLQTPDYCRYRMLEAVRRGIFPAEGVEDAVAARMERQRVLYDTSKQFEFVLWEPALLARVCPADVMAGQLDRLLSVFGLGNVTLAIIPLAAELAIVPMVAFLMADDVACAETPASDIYLGAEESAEYADIADGLLAEAVTGDEARQLITSAASVLRDGP